MKNRRIVILSGIIFLGSLTLSWSQSVTVNSQGGADYTSVSDALDAVTADPQEPNIITVTGGGPYEESLVIGVPVTIRGASPDNRPIILIRNNPGGISGRENDGIINSAPVDLTFENLIFLPSVTDTPGDDGFDIRPLSDDDHFSVTVRNVLITANDGSNRPLSLDGKELMDFSGATSFGDDGFQILSTFAGIPSGTVDALFENVIITHIDADGDPDSLGTGNDSFILGGERLTVTMRNIYVSFGDRFGLQLLSNVTANLEGTPTEPIVVNGGFGGIGSTGIRCFSGNHKWSYVTIMNTWNGVAVDSDTTLSLDVDHLLIANTKDWGLSFLYTPPSERHFTFTDCTLFNDTNSVVFDVPSSDTSDPDRLDRVTITLKDSICAGLDGDEFFLHTFVPKPDIPGFSFPNVILDHCAVVGEGDYLVDFGYRSENITEIAVITSDPQFVSIDPDDPGFLRVSSDAYRTAASDGGPLRGARPFAGEPAPVRNWMVF